MESNYSGDIVEVPTTMDAALFIDICLTKLVPAIRKNIRQYKIPV